MDSVRCGRVAQLGKREKRQRVSRDRWVNFEACSRRKSTMERYPSNVERVSFSLPVDP